MNKKLISFLLAGAGAALGGYVVGRDSVDTEEKHEGRIEALKKEEKSIQERIDELVKLKSEAMDSYAKEKAELDKLESDYSETLNKIDPLYLDRLKNEIKDSKKRIASLEDEISYLRRNR